MGMEDAGQSYNPVNSEEVELLDDYRNMPVEDKSMIRSVLKRLKVGRVQPMNQGAMAM